VFPYREPSLCHKAALEKRSGFADSVHFFHQKGVTIVENQDGASYDVPKLADMCICRQIATGAGKG
jgi:hypothetical protein